MKSSDKIVKETEFLVQKKTGGWEGWNIYARHSKFSKFSVSKIQKTKPRLTIELKTKIVKMALKERAAEKTNGPVFSELERMAHKMKSLENDFTSLILKHENVFNTIKKSLEDECEYVEINQALQRLLDYGEEAKEYKKKGQEIIPYAKREI